MPDEPRVIRAESYSQTVEELLYDPVIAQLFTNMIRDGGAADFDPDADMMPTYRDYERHGGQPVGHIGAPAEAIAELIDRAAQQL